MSFTLINMIKITDKYHHLSIEYFCKEAGLEVCKALSKYLWKISKTVKAGTRSGEMLSTYPALIL